jgi:MFS transporter, DHA2 family, glioxin efflux transporter
LLTALRTVFQCIGGAFIVSGAQAAFVNTMVRNVMQHDSKIDIATLVLTGATELRKNFPVDQLPIVIDGYMAGLKVVFAMCIACTGVATLTSLMVRWQKLNQENISGGMA